MICHVVLKFGQKFLSFCHNGRLTDGQTDRQKGLGNTVRCITCSRTLKTWLSLCDNFADDISYCYVLLAIVKCRTRPNLKRFLKLSVTETGVTDVKETVDV